jgi:hypothetical protein
VEQRAVGVDGRRPVPGQELEREERGAARRRALVLEAAAKELELLAVAELPDRAVGDGALAEVGASSRPLELVLPPRPQRRQLPLGA